MKREYTLADVPTMSDARIVEFAASRYGKVSPSYDDVLTARFPKYHEDRFHTQGWHRLSPLAMRMVTQALPQQVCRVCGGPLDMAHGNRRLCGPECQRVANRHHVKNHKIAGPALGEDERQEIVALYLSGLSTIEVSHRVRRSPSTVHRVVKGLARKRSSKRRMQKLRLGRVA